MLDKFNYLIPILLVIDSGFSQDEKPKPTPTPYQDWDYLLFSQRWPVTSCEQWQEKNENNKCDLPVDKTQWTVHGIWPTKIGTEGPLYCNSAIHFDIDQLIPIKDDLNKYWTNVEANTKPNSFWDHEWNKHGTCASILPQLDSVTNYFRKGLEWNKQYELSMILSKNKIIPGVTGYTVEDIFNSVKAVINKNPMIECVVESTTKESLISEIHICFNKSLDLIDCDVHKPNSTTKSNGVFSNCSLKKLVMYYGSVPGPSTTTSVDDYLQGCIDNNYYQEYQYRENLTNLYKLLKFLIWFTL